MYASKRGHEFFKILNLQNYEVAIKIKVPRKGGRTPKDN